MRAWRFSEFGDIGNFRLGEYPKPEAGTGEVLIKVRYAALNPADRLLIEGKYPGAGQLPLTVGREGAGTVEPAPPASGAFKPGDAVVVLRSEVGITRQGTLAEYVAVPEACVAPLPPGWSMEAAAGCPLVYTSRRGRRW
jgi:NADPH2:quinone reductase